MPWCSLLDATHARDLPRAAFSLQTTSPAASPRASRGLGKNRTPGCYRVSVNISGHFGRPIRWRRPTSEANSKRRGIAMRRALMGSLAVGALMSLLVRLVRTQTKDLEDTLTIWPIREETTR